ncbi:MAG: anti-sigma factor [Dehalococcoidia bacterium]|nr:anti-sigma factor [Dehalococcoidia bacterium]MCB9484615.1 anti-sigma factor [Thermoflexaceae bacterium]
MPDIATSPFSEHVDDLLAPLAVGTLNPADLLVAERHLLDCQHCRVELSAFKEAAAALRQHELHAPGQDLWERIQQALPGPGGLARPQGRPPLPGWSWWGGVAATALVAALIGAAVTRVGSDTGRPGPLDAIQQIATDDAVFTLATLNADSTAAGRIFMNNARTEGVIAVTGLLPLPATELYAVWIVRDDDIRLAAGTFAVDGEGSAVAALSLPDLQYDWTVSGRYVALTISRVDVDQPGTPIGGPILVGPLY